MVISSSTPAVEAHGLWKRYDERYVVRGVSIAVRPGELLGLVGPNGSGKTTTIRMLLNITPPDDGEISLFGGPMNDEAQTKIGYLPEERGLYQGLRVLPTLTYLAELKGMEANAAHERAEVVLERLGMSEHGEKRIKELSRGMRQLIQFGATIMHRPTFIVLDEPFSGLDPVNARLMKEMIVELSKEGAAIMFSTHQMTDVEELCDNVVMIHQGEVVLDGELAEVKRRFADDAIYVQTGNELGALPGTTEVRRDGAGYHVRLAPGTTPEELLRRLLDAGASIEKFEIATPSLEEIFLRLVSEQRA